MSPGPSCSTRSPWSARARTTRCSSLAPPSSSPSCQWASSSCPTPWASASPSASRSSSRTRSRSSLCPRSCLSAGNCCGSTCSCWSAPPSAPSACWRPWWSCSWRTTPTGTCCRTGPTRHWRGCSSGARAAARRAGSGASRTRTWSLAPARSPGCRAGPSGRPASSASTPWRGSGRRARSRWWSWARQRTWRRRPSGATAPSSRRWSAACPRAWPAHTRPMPAGSSSLSGSSTFWTRSRGATPSWRMLRTC
mmetsp:Transcript_17958/g.55565  ORF Transcript_17958/g.55565 Transcript_17958/m.55565 type:complete len:251 (+) Transcript_17958:717-1469(+)